MTSACIGQNAFHFPHFLSRFFDLALHLHIPVFLVLFFVAFAQFSEKTFCTSISIEMKITSIGDEAMFRKKKLFTKVELQCNKIFHSN